MKKCIRNCAVAAVIVVLVYGGVFLLCWDCLGAFQRCCSITDEIKIYGSCIGAVAFTIIFCIIGFVLIKSKRQTRLGNWLSMNVAKLSLAYILLNIFFVSIKSETIWSFSEIKEVVSLEWTIFGISVAIFLIWNVVGIEYCEQKKPKEPETKDPIAIWKYIERKKAFYSGTSMILSNINLLCANLICLIIATILVYLSPGAVTMLNQTIVMLSLLLCTNTIAGLLFDILRPFNDKKKEMLQQAKVTNEDVRLQNDINQQTEKTLAAIEAIEALPNIEQEEKMRIKSEIIQNYINAGDMKKQSE